MLDRFEGENGRRLRTDALLSQKMVAGNKDLADELASCVSIIQLAKGDVLIEQDTFGNDIFFILAGRFEVVINGRTVGWRGPHDHVGEMASIEPTQKRAASVIANDISVVARVTEPAFHSIANRYPDMYRYVAKELARRLLQRNSLINAYREKTRVFIISSAEALPIARAVQNAFQHDPFTTVIWTDGVFRVTNYTLQSLEDEIDNSDFAIAI